MKKCPIKPKTSDVPASNGQQSLSKRRDWGSVAGLAKLQGCSQRTMREWCKKGLIPEAYQTPGGHWRIQKPLSIKTRDELEKRRADWPFRGVKGGDIAGDFSEDLAEWLLLAEVYQIDLHKRLPVPTIAELSDLE